MGIFRWNSKVTPSTTGSTRPDFPGAHLLPHVVCTSLDTFCTCLRFACRVPNCTKIEYLHASPKTPSGQVSSPFSPANDRYISTMWPAIPLYMPYTQSSGAGSSYVLPCSEHTQPHLGATQAVQGPATSSVGSLLQINPILHHLSNMLECYNYPTMFAVF